MPLTTSNEPAGADGGERVTLAECPAGLFLADSGALCLKTEYGDNEGRIDAYIVESGEFFCGHAPQTIASQRQQMVRPVPLEQIADALTIPRPAALASTARAEAGDWQPMDTAPKDGTRLLCLTRLRLGPKGGPYRTEYEYNIGHFDDETGEWFSEEGSDIDPSCWQPLPAPPGQSPAVPASPRSGAGEGGEIKTVALNLADTIRSMVGRAIDEDGRMCDAQDPLDDLCDAIVDQVLQTLAALAPSAEVGAGEGAKQLRSRLEDEAWSQASVVSCYWIQSRPDRDLVEVVNRDLRLLYEATHEVASPPAPAEPGVEIREASDEQRARLAYDAWMGRPNAGGFDHLKPIWLRVVRSLSQGGGAGRSERAVEIRELSEKADAALASQRYWSGEAVRAADALSEANQEIERLEHNLDVAKQERDAACNRAEAAEGALHRSEIAGRSEKGEGELQAAVVAYLAALDAKPEQDCWDTETGEEEPGAQRFASDWAWADHHDRIAKALAELRAPAQSPSTSDREG